MRLTERLLNKSNSHIFFKENYKKLSKENKRLTNENKDLKLKLKKEIKSRVISKLSNKEYSKLTIAIKSPHPKSTTHWGDYFFSIALKKAFEKKGFNVIIQPRENWYDEISIDISIVLRGLKEYKPRFDEISLMWNISHPDLVSFDEYENFDIVFIASEKYAKKLDSELNTIVKPLLQCTDPEIFYREFNNDYTEDILFVGITRNIYREIVKDAISTNHNISVYGKGWDKFIDDNYIKGDFIPNEDLHKYYSSCKILLNDHWEDMRDLDFPSNRLFDALACGAFIISDSIDSAVSLFKGNIVTYNDIEDLNKKIEFYLNHEDERILKSIKGRQLVLENHTFDNRVDSILNFIYGLL